MRAFGGITAAGTWASAPGGAGGNTANDGGNGGAGRIRIDTSGALAAPSVTPVGKRGPAWDVATPSIVRTPQQQLTLHGEPGKMHGIRVGSTQVLDAQIDIDGSNEIDVTLVPGRNTVCALWTTNNTSIIAPDEARSCIDVVYVP